MQNYTLSDLVSFGEYLLSKERTKNVKSHPIKGGLCERLKSVSDADIDNWKEKSVSNNEGCYIDSEIEENLDTKENTYESKEDSDFMDSYMKRIYRLNQWQ